MSVAKVTEITASSKKGFQDAIELGLARAAKTLEGIKGPGFTYLISSSACRQSCPPA